MKNTFFLICLTIALYSCINGTVSTGNGSEKVVGDGKVVTEEREIASFNEIVMEGAFQVELKRKEKETVEVEADENVLPLIKTTVENNVLKIALKDDVTIQRVNKMNVRVGVVNIENIKFKGAGSLKSLDTLKARVLELDMEGAGSTSLLLNADKLIVDSDMVGVLQLAGNVNDVNIEHDGVGVIKAFELKAEKLSIEAKGVGAVEVYATDELVIKSSGIGAIKYKGGATKKEIKNNGIGKVECVDCE